MGQAQWRPEYGQGFGELSSGPVRHATNLRASGVQAAMIGQGIILMLLGINTPDLSDDDERELQRVVERYNVEVELSREGWIERGFADEI